MNSKFYYPDVGLIYAINSKPSGAIMGFMVLVGAIDISGLVAFAAISYHSAPLWIDAALMGATWLAGFVYIWENGRRGFGAGSNQDLYMYIAASGIFAVLVNPKLLSLFHQP